MNLTFTLNTSLITYTSAELNEQCKSVDVLSCSFYRDSSRKTCNAGSFTTCFDHSEFQGISRQQKAEYSSQIIAAYENMVSDFWCNIKAQMFALISNIFNNLVFWKQESMSENIERQAEFFDCNKNITVDLSEVFTNSFIISLSGENTVKHNDDIISE